MFELNIFKISNKDDGKFLYHPEYTERTNGLYTAIRNGKISFGQYK